MDGLKVRLLHLALVDLHLEGQAFRPAPLAQAVGQRLLELFLRVGPDLVPVHRQHGGPLGHDQPLPLELIAAVHTLLGHHLGQGVHRRLEGRVVLPDGHRDLLRGPHHMRQQLKAVSKKVLPADLIGLLGALRRVQAHVPGVQLGAQVLIAQG